MKKNILLIGMIDWFPILCQRIKGIVPDIQITPNYEEVLGLVKNNEKIRLCVITSGYNYSKSESNNIEGYEVARELHKINPDIPMMIVNGEETGFSEEGLSIGISVDKENEIYINTNDEKYHDKFVSGDLFKSFFFP